MERRYVNQVRRVCERWEITPMAFESDSTEAITLTAKRLAANKMRLDQESSDEKSLLALCAVDGLTALRAGNPSAISEKQFRYFLDSSLKIPKANDVFRERDLKKRLYAEAHYDPRASLEVAEWCADWGQDSLLWWARLNAGVTPETERPYEIVALSRTGDEIWEDWKEDEGRGVSAYVLDRGDTPKIVIGKGAKGSLIHEYQHIQFKGISGVGGMVFMGLEEGFIDRAYAYSNGYFYAMNTVDAFCMLAGEQSEEDLRGALRGNIVSRDNFFRSIIKQGGLNAMNYLAWMGRVPNEPHWPGIDPNLVWNFVIENLGEWVKDEFVKDPRSLGLGKEVSIRELFGLTA